MTREVSSRGKREFKDPTDDAQRILEIRRNTAQWKEIAQNPGHPDREEITVLLEKIIRENRGGVERFLGADLSSFEKMLEELHGNPPPEETLESLDRKIAEGSESLRRQVEEIERSGLRGKDERGIVEAAKKYLDSK